LNKIFYVILLRNLRFNSKRAILPFISLLKNYPLKHSNAIFIRIIAFNLLYSNILLADDVFKWTDADGKVHYSNSSKDNQGTKAELPQIEKSDFNDRLDELNSISNQTCVKRGGISCEAGKDEDGSVICLDGYRNSSEEFNSLCTEVRLQATIKLPENRSRKMLTTMPLTVTVRNNSAIEAQDVSVEVSLLKALNLSMRERLTLEGSKIIPAFGIMEYTFTGRIFDERILRKGNVSAGCKNCFTPPLPIPDK
jgi:hypothetical protein